MHIINRQFWTAGFIELVLSSCASSPESLHDLLVDKVWMDENDEQMFFSSKEGREYYWMTFDHRPDGTYTPFSAAKGTPDGYPLPKTYATYLEGWSPSTFFKIKGDSLALQDENDLKGKSMMAFKVEAGGDTTIGIFDFKTLRVTNEYGIRIWRTQKK